MKLADVCGLCREPMEGSRYMVSGPHPERTIAPQDPDADPVLEAHFHRGCVVRRYGEEFLWTLYQEPGRSGEQVVNRKLLELALERRVSQPSHTGSQ